MSNQNKQQISFGWAMVPLIIMILSMAFTIIVFKGSPHIPLVVGTIIASLIAWKNGYRWTDIESGFYQGIYLALPAILILMLIGLTIGSWIGGGIVATMVYYGLKLITPSMFLVSITLICAVVSLSIGSSWSTMGTIGVAGMGIGTSMGIPAPMVAGAIISGSYFGDKMSPLSDTTNLASGLTGVQLFDHIRHMVYTTLPGILLALGVYGYLGWQFSADTVNTPKMEAMMTALEQHFVISPWLFLVPLLVMVLVVRKVPAIPALVVGILGGFLCQIVIQGDPVGQAVNTLQTGFSMESGNKMADELLNRGGLESMMYTVSLTIVAMVFGGVMEQTGMLQAIVERILKLVKSVKGLIVSTLGSAFLTNVTASEQYISIVIPARMYADAYREKGLHPKNLSRALEDGGTLTSPFVPWSTCGVFIFSTLGVHAIEYAPYAVMNLLVPVISILFAVTGFTLTPLPRIKDQSNG
ncbi:Na+/H+ antiporter NhaC [Melghirimyces algeriensis]|uniref:Transporter, NhaC family n=1 Tax=Melghirimyces algeriensis TaxID=910412 RepID=A0A521CIN9_9BACL|nr:Na+/H+ antiporter NhaC [Melghirimyces algeriensis]SMO59343.1 transporter, NhaC family [Melghirimyces algeriensis]